MPNDANDELNPRTKRVHQVVLDAALDILFDEGADEVTAARVAERTQVARSTIYRHWPDQSSLLLAAIDSLARPNARLTTDGNLEQDVRRVLNDLAYRLEVRKVRYVYGALGSQAPLSEMFEEAQRRFIGHLTMPMQFALEAACSRGELDSGIDCRLEADLLVAPILHRYLTLYDDLPAGMIDTVVDRWLSTIS